MKGLELQVDWEYWARNLKILWGPGLINDEGSGCQWGEGWWGCPGALPVLSSQQCRAQLTGIHLHSVFALKITYSRV